VSGTCLQAKAKKRLKTTNPLPPEKQNVQGTGVRSPGEAGGGGPQPCFSDISFLEGIFLERPFIQMMLQLHRLLINGSKNGMFSSKKAKNFFSKVFCENP